MRSFTAFLSRCNGFLASRQLNSGNTRGSCPPCPEKKKIQYPKTAKQVKAKPCDMCSYQFDVKRPKCPGGQTSEVKRGKRTCYSHPIISKAQNTVNVCPVEPKPKPCPQGDWENKSPNEFKR